MSNSKDTRQKNPNVPTLRFLAYSDPWRSCSTSEYYEVRMCKRIFASQTNSEGEVPFFKIGTIGGVPDSYISSGLFEDYKRRFNFPEVGEVFITCSGTVGRCLQYDGSPAYYQDSNIVWLHGDKSPIESGFLYWLLKRHDWKTLNTTTISRIYSSDLLNLKLSFPTAKEQEKITHFLILIDRRIAVQNKIIKELDELMIALCKSMTIGPDATLAEVCECQTSTIKESVLSSSGKYPVYGATGLVGYLDTYDFEHPGLAVIKDGAGVGRNYPIDAARYSIIGTMALLLPRKDISITYLWASLQAMNFSSYVVGSGIPHIYFKDYKQSKIPNHSYSNICLSELSELIRKKRDGELEILSKMQVEKTYLLGNMFI